MSATREAAVIRRFVEAFRPLNINAAIPSDVAGNIPQMLRADSESLDKSLDTSSIMEKVRSNAMAVRTSRTFPILSTGSSQARAKRQH